MTLEIIEPFPPVIDVCDCCGAFKCVSYLGVARICHDCLKSLEAKDEDLYNNLDNEI